jgi:hypothetical protein
MTEYALGRLHIPDARDRRYPMETLIAAAPSRSHRYWNAGWRGDQNRVVDPDGQVRAKPWCVSFSVLHLLEAMGRAGTPDSWDPRWLYHEAQKVDQWEGENYDGTSVRAGLDVLRREGVIAEYRWTWTLDTLLAAVIDHGPVVVGTNWYDGMFTPDADGFIWPTGRVAGGHAYMVSGGNLNLEFARIDNSWGPWGDRGRAKMTFEVLARLLAEQGEAATVVLP